MDGRTEAADGRQGRPCSAMQDGAWRDGGREGDCWGRQRSTCSGSAGEGGTYSVDAGRSGTDEGIEAARARQGTSRAAGLGLAQTDSSHSYPKG